MKACDLKLIRNLLHIATAGLVIYSLYAYISNHGQRLEWLEMDAEYIGKEVEQLKDKLEQ